MKTELDLKLHHKRRHVMKMICQQAKIANIIHLPSEETQIPKGCHFLALPCTLTSLVFYYWFFIRRLRCSFLSRL